MKIVLASQNSGKIRELQAAVCPFSIELIPQADFHIQEIEETACTFIENALLKARHAAFGTGLPAMADDSGLSVTVLSGQPGIRSARYAGPHASSKDNIEKLLHALKGVPDEKRQAVFYCVIVYLNHAEDPAPLICQGRWPGSIASCAEGSDGFGYDPIFYVPSEKRTAAALPLARKNEISHRGLALRSFLQQLPEKLTR